MPGDYGQLIASIFTTDELSAATSDDAWLQAILDVEVALAEAEAELRLIPAASVAKIASAAVASAFDTRELGRAARLGGNPIIPIVDRLRQRVGGDAAADVHRGAMSQDIIDTAGAVLVRAPGADRRGSRASGRGVRARHAEKYRTTTMLGRTLLQPALPVSFGLTNAGWLVGFLDAREELQHAVSGLAAQLGGAAGTLVSLGSDGPDVVAAFARRLDLAGAPDPSAHRASAVGDARCQPGCCRRHRREARV